MKIALILFFSITCFAQQSDQIDYTKRIQDHIQKSLKEEVYIPLKDNDAFQAQMIHSLFNDCIEKYDSKSVVSALADINSIVRHCNKELNLLDQNKLAKMMNRKFSRSDEFHKALAEKLKEAQESNNPFILSPVVEVEEKFLNFNAIYENNQKITLPGSEKLFSVMNDFSKILIHYNRAKSLEEVSKDKGLDISPEVKLRLVQLAHFRAMIQDYELRCKDTEKHNNIPNELTRSLLTDLSGNVVTREEKIETPSQFFFSLPSEKLHKIESFRVRKNDGSEVILFRYDPKSSDNEVWVLAEIDEKNEVISFTHFELNVHDANMKVGDSSQKINLIPMNNLNKSFGKKEGRSLNLNVNLGVSLETDRVDIPRLGMKNVPTGKVNVAFATLAYSSAKVFSQTTAHIEGESIKLKSSLAPLKNSIWHGEAEVSYKPFNSDYSISAKAVVLNMSIGYAGNLKDKHSVQWGVYTGRNYVSLESDLKKIKAQAGRKFKNDRGGLYLDSDFRKEHNVTLFISLNKKKR